MHCEDAYDGCLCYNCKCTKCEWHSGNHPEGDEYYDFENDCHICVLVEIMRAEKQADYERGLSQSPFKIEKIISSTDKAIQCTLKNTKTKSISAETFWVPLSVINKKGFIRIWFAEKEIKNKFGESREAQTKLF
ncbi:hypothetical protein [Methanobacterium oryzae]|uniref:hypothetical protein n=1 Tax=Methanobacterium oryzae TaxID=69540 RepID=UPI003D207645